MSLSTLQLLGLMRSTAAICNDNVRVNLVAPWMTGTIPDAMI